MAPPEEENSGNNSVEAPVFASHLSNRLGISPYWRRGDHDRDHDRLEVTSAIYKPNIENDYRNNNVLFSRFPKIANGVEAPPRLSCVIDDPYSSNNAFKTDQFAPDYSQMDRATLSKATVKQIKHGEKPNEILNRPSICTLDLTYILGTYLVSGCESKVAEFERDRNLRYIDRRMFEKMEEYATPQRDRVNLPKTPYYQAFDMQVTMLVTQVTKFSRVRI